MKFKKKIILLVVAVCLFYTSINNWSSLSAPVCSHIWSRGHIFPKCTLLVVPVLAFFLANLNLTWIWAVALEQLLCSTKNQSKCLRNNVGFFAKTYFIFILFLFFLFPKFIFTGRARVQCNNGVFVWAASERLFLLFSARSRAKKKRVAKRKRVSEWGREGVCGCMCERESVRVLVSLFLWGPTLDGLPLLGAHFVWSTPTLSLNLRVKV